MRAPRKTHTVKTCDVCGGTGFPKLISTCFQCKIAREHVYCMRVLPKCVPQIWFCETCGSGDIVTQKSVRKELFHKALESNTSEIVHFDMSRSVGSRRLNEESGSSGYHKKKVSWRNGRVKFISFEEAVKMSSGVQNVKLPSPSKLHSSSVVQKDISETRSRRDATDLKSAPPKYSLQKGTETYKSAGHFKISGHGSEEISSITLAQESKTCTELKYKETSDEYKNLNLCKKESLDTPCINLPGGNLCTDAKPENSIIQGCDLLNLFSKPEINLPSPPVLDATWCGSLEILDMVPCGQFCDGFWAHLPGKVHSKAIEYSKLMPNVLRCTLLPCCNVWVEIFRNDSPTVNDMALFFSPGEFERSKQKYFSLLELLEMRDMALRTLINGVNLLIFPSKKLNLDSYGLEKESFMWGVYCPAKGHLAVPPLLI